MSELTAQVRLFAHNHDEVPAFHAGYLVLTLLAAALFNLGAFALLILLHMSLDLVKYRELHGYDWPMVLRGVFKESLVDCTLLAIGLLFAVYLHHSVGIAGLSGILRAEATIARALGTVVPKMRILQHILHILVRLRHYLAFVHPALQRGWTSAERFQIFFLAIALLLVAIAPAVLPITESTFVKILAEELVPWLL